MSMQSHLTELEKKHQALEQEINDCLTHPAVDDLGSWSSSARNYWSRTRSKRLRHNDSASVH